MSQHPTDRPGPSGHQLQSSCGELGLGPPAGAGGSSGGGGEGGAGAAGPRDGERDWGDWGRVQLNAVVGGRGRGGRVLMSPGGRGAQLDAANALCELERADRLAHVSGQWRHLHHHQGLAVSAQRVLQQVGEARVPERDMGVFAPQSVDDVSER